MTLPVILVVFVSGRIQWFIGIRHPELLQRDGSLIIHFQAWRFFIPVVGWLLTWLLAIGIANKIAESGLLPPIGRTPSSEVLPMVSESTKAQVIQPEGSAAVDINKEKAPVDKDRSLD